MKKSLKVLSLCDGKSGGQIALSELGYEILEYNACEINEHSIKLTQANFPNTIQLGDMTKLTDEELNKYKGIDLLIAGTPCQGFSVNGKKLNFEDDRSKLLFDFINIRDKIKPKYWMLENVATMNKDIKKLIDEYVGVEGVLINSNSVSPQNRKRYYWTNIEINNTYEVSDLKIKDILEEDVDFTYMNKEKVANQFINPSKTDGVITLNPKMTTGRQTYQQDRIYDCEGRMVALTATLGNRFYIKDLHNNIRKLTIREQARLQTIPEWYDFSSVSELQASNCIGNGWTISVVKGIFKGIN